MVAPSYEAGLAQRVERDSLELPVLPEVAQRVLLLVDDPDCSARDLSALVHRDPALAAHVLKIANSAGFGGRAKIVSLQQAVARLGMRLLAEIALAVSMSGVFEVPGQEQRVAQMWRRSLAAGLWAKEIARLGRRNVESAFLGGLLHRIGEPVALREAVLEAERSTEPPDEESMLSTVEQFAPEVGERIAVAWKLPAVTRSCILHHDYPEYAGAFVVDVWTVAFADAFAMRDPDLTDHPAVEPLNLYPDDLEKLEAQRERVEAALEAMCA